jgi:hypothetical protein
VDEHEQPDAADPLDCSEYEQPDAAHSLDLTKV